MNFITIILLMIFLSLGQSSKIRVLFPKVQCYDKESSNKVVMEDIKEQLWKLDEQYELILKPEFSQFDYSGGFNNVQLLDQCIMEMNRNLKEQTVCAAIKDIYLLEHVTKHKHAHVLFITDPIINIRFGIQYAETSYFTHLNYLFKVFHSSVWSLLLLIFLIIGMAVFILEFIGRLESREEHTRITIQYAMFITLFALWVPTVYKYLKTISAKFIFHMWQSFLLILLILYSCGVASLILNITNKVDYKTMGRLKTERIYCSQELETICNSLKVEYYNILSMENHCLNNSCGKKQKTYFYYYTKNLNKRYQENLIYLFRNNDLVLVSNNMSLVREINIKLLKKKKMFSEINSKNNIDISSNFLVIPIKLKHIYGPILLLSVGCVAVSIGLLMIIIKERIQDAIKRIRKKIESSERNRQNHEENEDETGIVFINLNKNRETEV